MVRGIHAHYAVPRELSARRSHGSNSCTCTVWGMMALPTKATVFCLGCGSDVTDRTADRRSLQSAVSARVVPILRAFLHELLDEEESEVDAEALISGGDQGGRMCRRCFSAFDRHRTLRKSIMDNLREALDVISPATTIPKRPRLQACATTTETPRIAASNQMQLSLQLRQPRLHESVPQSHTTISPDVAVSCTVSTRIQLYIMQTIICEKITPIYRWHRN